VVALMGMAGWVGVVPSRAAGPTVRVWDGKPDGGGTSVDDRWNTATNWQGDVAPKAGDVLVFPSDVAVKQSTNDFPPFTSFAAIRTTTPSGAGNAYMSGYSIGGN